MGLFRHSLGRVVPWLRLACFTACVSALVVFLGLRRVRAEAVEGAMAVGDSLEGLASVLPKPYSVRFNGQQAFVASATLEESVGTALDRMGGLCGAHDGGLLAAISDAAQHDGFAPPSLAEASPIPGVIRHESARGGFLACLSQDHHLGFAEVASRLSLLGKDGNLAHLGHVRFASARRTASGRTHLVVVWTEGAFFPRAAFPPGEDAPGTDLVGVGKPGGSRRVLAAAIDGAPYGVRVYHTREQDVPRVVSAFDRQLVAGGFQREILAKDPGPRAYRRGGEDLIVHAETGARGGILLSVVSIGHASAQVP